MDKLNVNEFINDIDLKFVEPIFCPKCFTTLQDFLSDGFLGCSNCYKIFEKEIKAYIDSVQASGGHIGKIYLQKCDSVQLKIVELENKLKQAVEEQRFEDCLSLKQKIEQLKEKSNG